MGLVDSFGVSMVATWGECILIELDFSLEGGGG